MRAQVWMHSTVTCVGTKMLRRADFIGCQPPGHIQIGDQVLADHPEGAATKSPVDLLYGFPCKNLSASMAHSGFAIRTRLTAWKLSLQSHVTDAEVTLLFCQWLYRWSGVRCSCTSVSTWGVGCWSRRRARSSPNQDYFSVLPVHSV